MTHEKIIKDERGRVMIRVSLHVYEFTPDYCGNWHRWDVSCAHIPKGKQKEIYSETIATYEEKEAAKNELWTKIKP